MKNKRNLLTLVIVAITLAHSMAQVKVDVNLNIKHSVEGVSDFGRERHITVHSTPTEKDWIGEEDKLDYLINDLDVYFGRDNGSATWKFQAAKEDPNNRSHVDSVAFKSFGVWLKDEYEKNKLAQQYQNKGAMIMGTNPHPLYPTLSWYPNGSTWDGWQTKAVDASAEYIKLYLDYAFRKSLGNPGEPMPTYWEVVNEIDMEFMTGKLLFTTYEHIWEYHNLVKQYLDERLGDKAPKVGGMTWGQHDFPSGDGLGRMTVEKALSYGVNPDAVNTQFEPYYKDAWFQWDVLFQGFMDACPTMDFWSLHFYDWPSDLAEGGTALRSGGVLEASLDMIEWYDNYSLGAKKELIVSEFGSVSGYLDEISPERRAWENLRPFNAMFMQFLERPSHITLTMPFSPIKAEWGDVYDADGNLTKRYPSTLLDKDENGDWQWTDFVLWYEQWSKVDGTRVETKADDLDIQVDAYVDGNHLYLIMNSQQFDPATLDLNIFGTGINKVQSVEIRNLYLDESLGTHGESVYDVRTFKTAPGSVLLEGNATVILDYTFENSIAITDEVKELKYMGEPLELGTTVAGGTKFRKTLGGRTPLVANINNVTVPTGDAEATLRISGKFWLSGVQPTSITINGHELSFTDDWRGETVDRRNYWFGTYEVDVPKEYLQENNEVTCTVTNNAVYTTAMLQVYDYSTAPKRSVNNDAIALTGISLPTTLSLMQNQTEALQLSFTPENATNKKVNWASDDTDVATVDEMGIVTAVSSTGTATITATSDEGGLIATTSVSTLPFSANVVTGISIEEGVSVDVDYYVTTQLHATILPADATIQNVVWSSSDEDIVEVNPETGKVVGKVIGQSATITATVTDTNNGDAVSYSDITVNVGIVGEETIYSEALPTQLVGNDEYSIKVPININGTRSVTVELVQDGTTVVGASTNNVDFLGKTSTTVNLNLNAVPAMGTNYALRTILKNGASVINEVTTSLEILDVVHVESVSINETYDEVEIGGELTVLSFVIEPENAFNKNVNWETSISAIATISPDGTITPHSEGEFTITLTSIDGGKSDQIILNAVSSFNNGPESIIIPAEQTVFPNATYSFMPEFTPLTLPESLKDVSWHSNNPSIANVNDQGLVTASGNLGSTVITVTSTIDDQVKATCNITVEPTLIIEAEDWAAMGGAVADIGKYAIADGMAINNVQKGDYVEYDVYVPSAGDYEITFVAATQVADGVIEFLVDGNSKGTLTLPTTTWDDFADHKMTAKVVLLEGLQTIRLFAAGTSDWQWNLDKIKMKYVGVPFDKIELSATFLNISIGSEKTLTPTVVVNGVESTNVSWSTDNSNIATVTDGVVRGVSEGTTTVKATSVENTELVASCTITVGELADPIVIEAEDFIAEGGDYDDGNGGGVNQAPGVGINYINNGDWAEYSFDVPEDGTYQITYYISCPTANGNISAIIDGQLLSTDHIANNGISGGDGWETYIPVIAANTAQLTVGTHTFKIEASGSAWQWNLDKIELLMIGAPLSIGDFSKNINSIKVFPNPATTDLNIWIEDAGVFQIMQIYSYTGQLILNEDISNKQGVAKIDVSSLSRGMYVLKVSGKETETITFIKQ